MRLWPKIRSLLTTDSTTTEEQCDRRNIDLVAFGQRFAKKLFSESELSDTVLHDDVERVLRSAYRDVALTVSMIDDLDRLLGDPTLDDDRVEYYRCKFFDQFSESEISDVIYQIYEDERADAPLLDIVQEQEIDTYRYEVPIRETEPVMGLQSGMKTTDIEVKTVDSMKIGVGIDLGTDSPRECCASFVAEQASMLYDKLDPIAVSSDDDTIRSWYDCIDAVYEHNGLPDTYITTDPSYVTDDIGKSIQIDDTDVIDESILVADSDHTGYKLTLMPETVETHHTRNFYSYTLRWAGNFAITDSDMVAVATTVK